MNTNLNEITTLTQLHTALTNKPIKAQLGEKGGRKFTIGNEQKSLHEIVTQYLSILKTVDLTDSKNRKIAANILEKLQTIKEDHDFTENLTLYKKINLGFRKTIGNLYHGSQNDLQKKFLRAVNSNLKINEKNYNSYTVRVELKKLMKRISIEASLSPELIIEQQKLSKQLEGIQKDNKTIKNINLDDLKKLKSSNSKELKELQVWCKKLKTEIASHPEIDKKLIVRLDQFSDMAALLAYTKKDIQQIDITLNDAVDKSKRPYSYEGLSIPDASEFIYRSSPQSRPLEQIEDLGELNRALTRGKVTETNETIYAHLGKEGGRRFIIGNQEYSFHDIANKSLLLLEKTNLTKAENRDSAKNYCTAQQFAGEHSFFILPEQRKSGGYIVTEK